MASIYNIQQYLFEIFDQIEANEGEITPELEEQLRISQDEFEDKIRSYTCVIHQLENDLSAIKDEKARLDAIKKSKEKTVERLKQIMVNAIQLFGDTSKTGVKFIDYGTGKVSIRKSESIEIDEDNLKIFTKRVITHFNELNWHEAINSVNVETVLDECNVTIGAKSNEDKLIANLSEDDLKLLTANLSVNASIEDLIKTETGRNLVKAMLDYSTILDIKPNINKTDIKKHIKEDGEIPAFANLVQKQNINIK